MNLNWLLPSPCIFSANERIQCIKAKKKMFLSMMNCRQDCAVDPLQRCQHQLNFRKYNFVGADYGCDNLRCSFERLINLRNISGTCGRCNFIGALTCFSMLTVSPTQDIVDNFAMVIMSGAEARLTGWSVDGNFGSLADDGFSARRRRRIAGDSSDEGCRRMADASASGLRHGGAGVGE